jgi:hypothetical protein
MPMLVNIRKCTVLGGGMFRTFMVFVMCSFACYIQMESFHIMSECNVRFNKLPALLYTLILFGLQGLPGIPNDGSIQSVAVRRSKTI